MGLDGGRKSLDRGSNLAFYSSLFIYLCIMQLNILKEEVTLYSSVRREMMEVLIFFFFFFFFFFFLCLVVLYNRHVCSP